jgi:flagellar basal body rod protein FlgG
MLYGLYLSASGLQAQELRQNVITNNLANANTTGFKRDLAVIQARANPAYEDPTMAQYRNSLLAKQGGGVIVQGAGVDLTQASLVRTGNPTDVALEGRGFFVVKGEGRGSDDQTALTRDGRFMINSQGTLVAATSGRPVLDTEGQAITLDPTLRTTIDATGEVSQSAPNAAPAVVAQLKLADVTDPRHVIKLGQNLMTVDDPKALRDISPSTTLRSGYLEQSGVDPVVEMVNMMEGQRVFDANAKMISLQDQTLQQLNTIGRIA